MVEPFQIRLGNVLYWFGLIAAVLWAGLMTAIATSGGIPKNASSADYYIMDALITVPAFIFFGLGWALRYLVNGTLRLGP